MRVARSLLSLSSSSHSSLLCFRPSSLSSSFVHLSISLNFYFLIFIFFRFFSFSFLINFDERNRTKTSVTLPAITSWYSSPSSSYSSTPSTTTQSNNDNNNNNNKLQTLIQKRDINAEQYGQFLHRTHNCGALRVSFINY